MSNEEQARTIAGACQGAFSPDRRALYNCATVCDGSNVYCPPCTLTRAIVEALEAKDREHATLRDEVEAFRSGLAAGFGVWTGDPHRTLVELGIALEQHHQEHHAREDAAESALLVARREREEFSARLHNAIDTGLLFAEIIAKATGLPVRDVASPDTAADAMDAMRARLTADLEAARELLVAMDRIEASDDYRGVWAVAFAHGYVYRGEKWEAQREALRDTLRTRTGEG